ncbi:hypothetical protein AB9F45_37285, partial [Rhizobium leguminosarum]
PLETEAPNPAPATFTPCFDESRVVTLDTMRDIVSSGAMQIADARSAGDRIGADDGKQVAGRVHAHQPVAARPVDMQHQRLAEHR